MAGTLFETRRWSDPKREHHAIRLVHLGADRAIIAASCVGCNEHLELACRLSTRRIITESFDVVLIPGPATGARELYREYTRAVAGGTTDYDQYAFNIAGQRYWLTAADAIIHAHRLKAAKIGDIDDLELIGLERSDTGVFLDPAEYLSRLKRKLPTANG